MDIRRRKPSYQRYSNIWYWRMGTYSKRFLTRLGMFQILLVLSNQQLTEDIRLKACRLLGIQHIEVYNGFKGGIDEIRAVMFKCIIDFQEWNKNKETGLKSDAWYNNVLIDRRFGLIYKKDSFVSSNKQSFLYYIRKSILQYMMRYFT